MLYNPSKKGFTLIELAVVLVIIGIVVAGILRGKDLIDAAKRNRTIKEVEEMEAALHNFRGKYNAIPGDFYEAERLWGASVTDNGDNDGKVDRTITDVGETLLFWQHLMLAEIYPGKFTAALVDGDYAPKENIPGSDWSVAAGYIYYDTSGVTTNPTVFGKSGNVLEFGECGQYSHKTGDIACYSPTYKPAEAESIDQKIDDGRASTGKMFGVNALRPDWMDQANNLTYTCSGNAAASSANYDLDADADTSVLTGCRLFFWLETDR